jgi:hypothetical protein
VTALSTRDALIDGIRDHRSLDVPSGNVICTCNGVEYEHDQWAAHVVDSLPVVDAATLADDEELIADLAATVGMLIDGHHDSDTISALTDALERALPECLAATLSERAS